MDEGEDDADREKQNFPSLSEGGKKIIRCLMLWKFVQILNNIDIANLICAFEH